MNRKRYRFSLFLPKRFLFCALEQKYKAFAAEIDNLQKVLKKKGAAEASAGFSKVEVALDAWLAEVELPPAREL